MMNKGNEIKPKGVATGQFQTLYTKPDAKGKPIFDGLVKSLAPSPAIPEGRAGRNDLKTEDESAIDYHDHPIAIYDALKNLLFCSFSKGADNFEDCDCRRRGGGLSHRQSPCKGK
jgi:hypothetical protein